MTTFQILMVIFLGLVVIAGITGLIILLIGRNRNNQTNNNQQPNTNLCNGPIPVPNSNVHIPEQNLPLTTYLSICNNRNPWPWIIASVLGVLFVLFLILFLTNTPSTSAKDEKTETITTINTPAPLPVPQFPNDYAKKTDIDSATAKITSAISQHDKNLTEHRESSKRGYSAAKKQREEILAVVKGNSGKLDKISQQIADLDASITSLRGELSTKVNDLKTALTDSANAQKINSLTDEINQLRARIENLEKQKNLIGDPD